MMSCENFFISVYFIFLNLASYTICLKILFIFSKQITSRLSLKPTGALTEVLLKLCTQHVFKQKHLLQESDCITTGFLKMYSE